MAIGSEDRVQTIFFHSYMSPVTLNVRSRPLKSNQFLRSSQLCICASLVYICHWFISLSADKKTIPTPEDQYQRDQYQKQYVRTLLLEGDIKMSYYAIFSASADIFHKEKIFKGFVPYMGMAAILVM